MTVIGVNFRSKVHIDVTEIHMSKPCCIQQSNGLFYCSHLNWYLKEHCGFENRRECNNFRHQCGTLFNTNR